MRKQLAAAMAAFGLLANLPVVAQQPDAQRIEQADEQLDEQLDELETVIIVGGFMTPRFWKVSKGDHVMWVLGNSGPAPAGVQWRTEQLDAHVAESQQVMYQGWVKAGVDIGVVKALTLLPAAFKAAKNPDNKTLKDVLTAEAYARWRVLKTAYVGRDNDIEKWRPSIAIGMLESAVEKKIGVPRPKPRAMGPSLRSLVDKAAKKHRVKIHTMPTVEREIKVKNAREILKSVHHVDLGDKQCFMQQLDYLERYIEYRKQHANASGDQPAQNDAAPRQVNCDDALFRGLRSGEIPDPAGALKVLDEMELQSKLGREQLDTEWIAAARAAIAKNKSTFSVLSMRQISQPNGYLAKLRELGYEVEEIVSTVN